MKGKSADYLLKKRSKSTSRTLKVSTKLEQSCPKIDDDKDRSVLRMPFASCSDVKTLKKEKETIIDLTDDNDGVQDSTKTAAVAAPKFIPGGLLQDTAVDTQNSETATAQYNSPCPAKELLAGMTDRKRKADESLPMDVDSNMQNYNGVMNNDNSRKKVLLFETLPDSRANASQSDFVSVMPMCSAAPSAPRAPSLTAAQSNFSRPPKPGFRVVKQIVKTLTGRQCINAVYVPQQLAAATTFALAPQCSDPLTVSSGTCPSASVSSTNTVGNASVTHKTVSMISATNVGCAPTTQSSTVPDSASPAGGLKTAHNQLCLDANKPKLSTKYRKPAEDAKTNGEEMDLAIKMCGACDSSSPLSKTTQCKRGHIVCGTCVEKEIRDVMTSKKMNLSCPVSACNDIIMLESVCDLLSPLVFDLLRCNIQQREQEASAQAISKMEGFVSCPACSYSGLLDTHILHFVCGNPDCRKECCRHCKANFQNAADHVECPILGFVGLDCFRDLSMFPANWDSQPEKKTFTQVVVPLTSKEGTKVRDFYSQTSKLQICRIFRIQNHKLWEKYVLERKHMQEEIEEENIKERLLFHGTRQENVPKICHEGFDMRIPVANGAAYGKGIYFSTSAKYSEKFALGSRTLLIVRVLCGRSTQGTKDLTRPPYDQDGRMYDSCVNNIAHPSKYVIFNPAQCYPQYMVETDP